MLIFLFVKQSLDYFQPLLTFPVFPSFHLSVCRRVGTPQIQFLDPVRPRAVLYALVYISLLKNVYSGTKDFFLCFGF